MSGFVYLWFDRKHHRFYIGSHWGSEDDGYICSSRWMRNAYKRRPHDFRRRILVRCNERNSLYTEEFKWLAMIDDHELGRKYYNLRKHAHHWTVDDDVRKTVGQKIATSFKTSEKRKQFAKKQSEKMKKRMPPTNRGLNWWNDGSKNIMTQECPEGFSRGKLSSGSWWNNSQIEIKSIIPPDGFERGRLKETGQKISLNKKGKPGRKQSFEEIQIRRARMIGNKYAANK